MLKKNLHNKNLSLGSWITIGHPAIAEIMAKAGFDWLAIDLEHSCIDLACAENLIRTIDLCGVAPLVRLTSNNSDQVKRVMDAGSHGIIVPQVNSAESAEKAVSATRYGPQGSRGVGLARAQGYGSKFESYFNWQTEGVVVIVQIEHIDAVNRLEAILSVSGIDGLIIGPYDLSCSMGIPGQFKHPLFIETIEKIRETGKTLECSTGIHIVEPDTQQLNQAIKDGFSFIAYSVDIRMLDVSSRNALSECKQP